MAGRVPCLSWKKPSVRVLGYVSKRAGKLKLLLVPDSGRRTPV